MIPIQIDKKSEKPLYLQIRDQIRQAIDNNELSPGDKLPAVTAFAKQVGVTQATIRRALADLSQAGLTHCHVGRGTFVAAPDARAPAGASYNPGGRKEAMLPVRAARQFRRRVSKGLCDLMAAASRPGAIDFSRGVPDPSLIPPDLFNEMVSLTLEAGSDPYLAYGDIQGDARLREIIAARYGDKGLRIGAEQILLTIGSQQGMSIAALYAAENQHHVIVETPGFQGVVDAFTGHGNPVETVTDLNGGDMAGQLAAVSEQQPALLTICPDFRNPTGEVMSPELRKKIADWASQGGGLVLSDEIFQDLRLDGNPPKSMMGLLGAEQTIMVSSLSKSLIPGLRVGWMISSRKRICEFIKIKRLMAQTSPPLMEGVAGAFLRSGAYDAHLARIKEVYTRRREMMLSCLEEFMPRGVSWTSPQGGFSLWVTLPAGYSSVALLISLLDKGVNMVPGPVFDMDQRFVNSFRMGWSWTGTRQIHKGVEILADAVKELLGRPPGDAGLSGLGHF